MHVDASCRLRPHVNTGFLHESATRRRLTHKQWSLFAVWLNVGAGNACYLSDTEGSLIVGARRR